MKTFKVTYFKSGVECWKYVDALNVGHVKQILWQEDSAFRVFMIEVV